MSEPLVSVVTPAYNAAEYIDECVKSVIAQTHQNWIHTIVDNASTDETPAIVASLAAEDDRVRLLRSDDFVDAIENHNRAFRATDPASAFCKMVQADDWLFPECLSQMVEAARAPEIGVVSSYRLCGTRVDLTGLPYWKTAFDGREILRQSLLGGPYVTGAPTAVLFRSSIVLGHDPFFDPTYWHSDTDAVYRILTRLDFGFVHQVLTFARRQGLTRATWAEQMNTNGPEAIRFLLRYGPVVLDEPTYRSRLRLELRKYLSFHARQIPKPSRLEQADFFRFHREEVDRILEDGSSDIEVRTTALAVRALLLRDRFARGRQGRASA